MKLNLCRIPLRKTCKVLLICSKWIFGTPRQFFLTLVVITISLTASSIFYSRHNYLSLNETHRLVQNRLKEYILQEKGTGCEMPKLDPFSAEVMKFNEDLPKIICEGFDWVNCHKSECYVVEEILKNMTGVLCFYRDILYENDKKYLLSKYTKVKGGDKYKLNSSDHVKISCTGTKLNSINLLPSVWHGVKAGFRPVVTKPIPPDRLNAYNVMILAFDSLSLNGCIRKMPKSYKYLSERAVILNSHNIVGDGTSAALYGILTGKAEDELPDARKSSLYFPLKKIQYVDETLFIFHLLKSYGYRTAYFEDSPFIGTFQYKFNGFRRQPADHYLRAFFMEKSKINSFINKRSQDQHCVGAIPQYQLMMNLSDEFLQLDGKKFCFTIIADISHDNFNLITNADEAVISFIENLATRKALEDTLLLVMGDHGSRFQPIRQTYQGKLEERIPLMAIILPEKLKKLRPQYLSALKQNRDVITTVFDIHTTVLDVLDLKNESNKYFVPGSDLRRGLSLLKPIPKTRSCSEAGIVQHWCACTKWFNVSQSDPLYGRVANVLAEYIDSITQEQRSKCEIRKLISIKSVLQQNVNTQLLKHGYDKEIDSFIGNPKHAPPRGLIEYYQAKIIMSPGRGVFEGTLMYYTTLNVFKITQKDISRISPYGDEPKCVSATNPNLNPFCYCKDKLLQRFRISNRSINLVDRV